jgi:hypothetical protein
VRRRDGEGQEGARNERAAYLQMGACAHTYKAREKGNCPSTLALAQCCRSARALESERALVRQEPANSPPPTPPPTGTVLVYNGNIFFYRLISLFLIVADDCRRIGRV